jgi:signal transduction histidine kinase
MRACEARAGGFALRDPTTGSVTLHVLDQKKRLKRFPLREGQGFVGWTMQENEAVLTNEADTDARRGETLDDIVGFACGGCVAVPLEGEDGTPMGAVALYNGLEGREFTDEDRALLVLIAANASTAIQLQLARESREREERLTTIGRLLSGVIHDLKTPLTVISGYIQLMQHAEAAELRSEYAELALKQFDHIGAMQKDILEFARGEKRLLVRKIYLHKFFDDVRAQLETQLARLRIELVIDLHDRGTARFDEGKMLRVVHNLARNAAEAMADKGGKLTIKVARDRADDLVVTFTDTGPGIPKEIEHRLFQSFVTSGKKGGTGLGLAIVKHIIDEHGGTISVHSTSKGASFKLRLPQKNVQET